MSPFRGRCSYYVLISLLIGLGQGSNPPDNIDTTTDYRVDRYTNLNVVSKPRSLVRDEVGDILVLSQDNNGQVQALYEAEDTTVKTAVIIDGKSFGLTLNHGLAYSSGYLYASTSGKILRWGYNPGQRSEVSVDPEVIVEGMPEDGEYLTRSLVVDRYNRLYVSVGAAKNAEETNSRAQIRRFNMAEGVPEKGFKYQDGETFATGVRNAVGLATDQTNVLWGADCGADNLTREDLGGDIHNTNPADELIRFVEDPKAFYGYPYCWTIDQLEGYSRGQQYAWPDFMGDNKHTDVWCQNEKNNRPPTLTLPAHSAPLGLIFYDGTGCNSGPGSFPCSMTGDLFIALHGSTNRMSPTGYKVVRVHINKATNLPEGNLEDIVFQSDTSTCFPDPKSCFRPVDVTFSQSGHLIISSDSTNDIIRVTRKEGDSKIVSIIKKSLHIPGVIALAIVALFTTCLIILLVRNYCCRRTEEVPYIRENI